ncbi:MAG: hypothetical protein WB967_15185 [Mycobacterium sp.]|uniref:hypothetical protein n=1 Tax=Mycobacterium sp. TaxID=1785 RepID=UPI003C3C9599
MFIMLLITLVAVGAAVAAWLRPIPHEAAAPTPPSYSEQQVADAKAKVCDAYGKVQKATTLNAARNGGDDPNAQLLIATTQRQVFVVGSSYLLTTLAEEPAAPADLAAAANDLAHLYRVITLDGLVGDRNDPAHNEASEIALKIQGLCK